MGNRNRWEVVVYRSKEFLLINYAKKAQMKMVTVREIVIPSDVRIRPFVVSFIVLWASTSFK